MSYASKSSEGPINKDLYKIQSTDSLPDQTAITLRKFAHCIGINKSHWVNQKEQLIQMVMIQAPLESGIPDNEIDITECMKYCDIEFIETIKSVKWIVCLFV